MQILLWVGRVSRIYSFPFWPYYVQQQSKDYLRLAETQESQGYSILLRFHKLLPPVYLQLLKHCHSIDIPHPEGHFLEVQLLLSRYFQLSFTFTLILTHWISDAQLIMETDASDYALTAILSIVNEENEVHLVAFYFCTFNVAELNYDTYDKELLAIFEAFKIWWHYLEGLAYPIDVVMDHKNLEYFSTINVLIQRQA